MLVGVSVLALTGLSGRYIWVLWGLLPVVVLGGGGGEAAAGLA